MQVAPIVSSVQQAEQMNGYCLITLTLNTPVPFEEMIGNLYSINQAPDIELALFQYPETDTGSYQFLCRQPLPSSIVNGNHQETEPSELSLQKMSADSLLKIDAWDKTKPTLILASALYMALAFALSKRFQNSNTPNIKTVLLHSSDSFPFQVKPARFLMHETPPEAIGASTLLEDWKIQNRLASSEDLPGCFQGELIDMFAYWLQQNSGDQAWQFVVLAEKPIQKKCLRLSQSYDWIHLTGTFEAD